MTLPTAIDRIETYLVSTPLPDPIRHPFLGSRTKFANLVVLLRTADGCTGFGYVTGESVRQMAAVGQIVEDLAGHLRGIDALRREFVYDRMWGLTVDLLHEGAATLALSAIDMALWDICGKQAGQPLWRLLGGFRQEVPAYASYSLWRHMTIGEIEAAGAEIVERGFKAMKLRLGGRPFAEDIERARVLRRAVGPDVAIMTDALWGFRPSDAIRLARGLVEAEVDLTWFEEPVRDGDFDGLKRVRDTALIPVAAGERLSSVADVARLLPAIDHAILDVHHIGGITPWIKAAALLEAADVPISAHIGQEIQVHLLGAYRTGAWIEYFPWWDALFEEPLQPKDGMLELNGKPGLGVEVSQSALARLAAER